MSQSYVLFFEISIKLRIFLYPYSPILSKKIWTLLSEFGRFFWDKNLHHYAKSQNREKCLLYFDLRILIWIHLYIPLFKIPTLTHPIVVQPVVM